MHWGNDPVFDIIVTNGTVEGCKIPRDRTGIKGVLGPVSLNNKSAAPFTSYFMLRCADTKCPVKM